MKLMGEKGAKVRPLNDKRAIENGANFLSETFVFAVAGGLILFESYRQRQKELSRRETVADDIKTLQYEIQYLKRKLKEYNVKLDDYIPPDDVKPLVLKLDQNGNEVELDVVMDKLKERIKKIEQAHQQEPQSSSSSPKSENIRLNNTNIEIKQNSESKILKEAEKVLETK
ncbi:OPA3-like protein [Wickerhamomyces ciferrii]|uniref:OPA3-like protein n=1 Tax=Wickerhamomyces ciferrii (strain ATCC 14091 / BCRC 22168 / CBS 111 / JCM 3599 / NBRC 0793 / NRRL Y-1031 F-60-10) TaxID=1206466 RepID=K0KK11_WICCF|nr:OPA3-like protein [Wickerhamomyces ciferrii]CCH42512.1 OPA3-like protein [Wickerhamomyces ciferrii]